MRRASSPKVRLDFLAFHRSPQKTSENLGSTGFTTPLHNRVAFDYNTWSFSFFLAGCVVFLFRWPCRLLCFFCWRRRARWRMNSVISTLTRMKRMRSARFVWRRRRWISRHRRRPRRIWACRLPPPWPTRRGMFFAFHRLVALIGSARRPRSLTLDKPVSRRHAGSLFALKNKES